MRNNAQTTVSNRTVFVLQFTTMKRFISMLLYHIGLTLISLAYALDSNLLPNLLADAIASKPADLTPGDGSQNEA